MDKEKINKAASDGKLSGIVATALVGVSISILSILCDLCVKAYIIGNLDYWNLHISYISNEVDYINILLDIVVALLIFFGNMLGYYVFSQEKNFWRKIKDMMLLCIVLSIIIATLFLFKLRIESVFYLNMEEVTAIGFYSCYISSILFVPGVLTWIITGEHQIKQKFLNNIEGFLKKVKANIRKERNIKEDKKPNIFIRFAMTIILCVAVYIIMIRAFWCVGELEASSQREFKLTEYGVVIYETEESYVLAENYTITGFENSEKDIFINRERQIVKSKNDIKVKILYFDDVFVLDNYRYIEDVSYLATETIIPFELC